MLLKDQKDTHFLEEAKIEQALKSIPLLQDEVEKLKDEIREKDEKLQRNDEERGILARLFDKGIIDSDGNLINQVHHDDMN